MFSDTIKSSGIICSKIPNLPVKLYLDGSNSSAGALTTLDSVVIPAGAFQDDGDYMDFEYFGTFAGDADTEAFLYFGTDAIFDSAVIDPANEDFILRGRMVRTGPTTQYTVGVLTTSTLSKCLINSTAITFGPEITLAFKGIGTSGSAVSVRAAFRRFHFQNR